MPRTQAAGKLKDAERLYLFAKRPDFAITMFRNHERYNDMLRLVAKHHPELLAVTHLDLAQQLETEGRYREAEKHYVAGDDWKAAINMFRANDAWEDAYRVAKRHGGQAVANQVGRVVRGFLGVPIFGVACVVTLFRCTVCL